MNKTSLASLRLAILLLTTLLSAHISVAAPLDLLGVRPGTTHRLALGGGEITARVAEIGREGWVQFSVLSDDLRWPRGTRIWINLDRIDNISTPIGSSPAAPAESAPQSDSDIARLPCFSQVEAREAQALAKGQSFDRNQFLTECILQQRRKP